MDPPTGSLRFHIFFIFSYSCFLKLNNGKKMPSLEIKLFVMQLRSYFESFKTLNLDPFIVS